MKIVIFGLSISSAWGNGHATLLRGLFRALNQQGHEVHFFERETPYYAAHRDAHSLPFADLHLYGGWTDVLSLAQNELSTADVAMVTSYCPDGVAACELVLESNVQRKVFYDLDTPVTLSRLERGEAVDYVPGCGLSEFDLVLSYTGGRALDQLRKRLGARRVATLYGWVDSTIYHRVDTSKWYEASLSYLGTYSADRQAGVDTLLIEPAKQLENKRFVIAGAMYTNREGWPGNIRHYEHIAPPEHSAFYSSAPLTLNVTRASMAAMGYCPSGRLFEAAACGTAVLSDWWEGLDAFFEPGLEILIARSCLDAISEITADLSLLKRIAGRAKERTLDCHTAEHRARRLVALLESPADEVAHSQEDLVVARGA
jgi:spore maturation protein CgeB